MKYTPFFMVAALVLMGTSCTTESKKGKHMEKPVVGSMAPDFTLPDQNEKEHTLSSYHGHRVALYFYPKDETPGCTAEACSLRDGRAELEAAGIVVLGVSYDTPKSHLAFAKKHNLDFTLLSDTTKEVSAAYGVKGWFMPSRVTFLIDENGKIVSILKNVNVSDHADEIISHFDK